MGISPLLARIDSCIGSQVLRNLVKHHPAFFSLFFFGVFQHLQGDIKQEHKKHRPVLCSASIFQHAFAQASASRSLYISLEGSHKGTSRSTGLNSTTMEVYDAYWSR